METLASTHVVLCGTMYKRRDGCVHTVMPLEVRPNKGFLDTSLRCVTFVREMLPEASDQEVENKALDLMHEFSVGLRGPECLVVHYQEVGGESTMLLQEFLRTYEPLNPEAPKPDAWDRLI